MKDLIESHVKIAVLSWVTISLRGSQGYLCDDRTSFGLTMTSRRHSIDGDGSGVRVGVQIEWDSMVEVHYPAASDNFSCRLNDSVINKKMHNCRRFKILRKGEPTDDQKSLWQIPPLFKVGAPRATIPYIH